MSKQKILSWGDIGYAARIATGMLEQEWEALDLIWQAWEILIQAGLATYSTKIDLCQVVIRFLAIVSFCIEFCDYDNWEYYLESFALEWVEAININIFYYNDIIYLIYPWDYPVEPEDEDTIECIC